MHVFYNRIFIENTTVLVLHRSRRSRP